MNYDHFDHRLLVTVLSSLDDAVIDHIRKEIRSHEELRERFEHILTEMQQLEQELNGQVA